MFASAQLSVEGEKITAFQSIRCLGAFRDLGYTWGAVWSQFIFRVFLRSKNLYLLRLFRRLLQCCSAVKLQECFVDCKTSPNFLTSLGWEDKSLKYKNINAEIFWVYRLKFESSEYLWFICRIILTDIYIRNTCRFCFVQTVGGLPSGYRGSKETPCETDGARQTDLCWRVVS